MENIIRLERGPKNWWQTAKDKLEAEEKLEISILPDPNQHSVRGLPLANEVRLKYQTLQDELERLSRLFGDRQTAIAAIDNELAHAEPVRHSVLQTLREFLDLPTKPTAPAETKPETIIKRRAA